MWNLQLLQLESWISSSLQAGGGDGSLYWGIGLRHEQGGQDLGKLGCLARDEGVVVTLELLSPPRLQLNLSLEMGYEPGFDLSR